MIRTYALIALALALAGSHWWAYSKGKAADKERSDAVIATMVSEAEKKLNAANTLIRQQADAMQANRERADRERQTERLKNERRIADAVATDRLVRDELAAFARGAGADQDSVAACRSDASTLGNVLGEALSAHRVCTASAEDEAANARALLEAWPTMSAPK